MPITQPPKVTNRGDESLFPDESTSTANKSLENNAITGVRGSGSGSGDYLDLTNRPNLFDGNYNSLTNIPSAGVTDYNNLSNLPTLFDSDYNNLTNTPTIPVQFAEKRMNYTQINNSATETVAYLNVMGQSNADGTQEYPLGEQMGEADRLANVYHLGRSSAVASNGQFGAWTEESTWAWTNFIATEDNNLCRRAVGFYKNGTTEFAKKWQARIDGGEVLPDLYITHFSYSGNGFHKDDLTGTKSRFNPFEVYSDSRENVWQGTQILHKWALDNLLAANVGVVHLGILYNQWEHDSQDATAAANHQSWVQSLLNQHDKISGIKTPLTYYVPSTDGVDGRFAGFETCKAGFEAITDRITVAINPRELAAYDTSINTINGYNGIYHDDVHYNLDSHTLLAEQMYTKGMYKGILITSTTIPNLDSFQTASQITSEITTAAPKTLWNANEYVSDASAEIVLAGVTQYRSGTDRQEFRAVRESDGKKYFRMDNRGSQFFFAFFEGLPSDTIYGSLNTRIAAGSRIGIGAVIGVSDVAEGVTTYKSTGKNMIAMVLGCDSAHGAANASNYGFAVWNLKNNASSLASTQISNVGLPLGNGTTPSTDDVDIRFQSSAGNSATTMTFRVFYKLTTDTTYTLLAEHLNLDVSNVEANVLDGGSMGIVSGFQDLGTTAMANSMRFKTFELISDE